MEQLVTVAIVEDHPVITGGWCPGIRSDPGQRVFGKRSDWAIEEPHYCLARAAASGVG